MATYDISNIQKLPEVVDTILSNIPGDKEGATVLALHGDLGAGKTTFVQRVARALGITEVVTSPTFVIMKGYETVSDKWHTLIHIDAYRFEDENEAGPLRFTDIISNPSSLVCLEWAERITSLLPANTVHLYFNLKDSNRTLEVK